MSVRAASLFKLGFILGKRGDKAGAFAAYQDSLRLWPQTMTAVSQLLDEILRMHGWAPAHTPSSLPAILAEATVRACADADARGLADATACADARAAFLADAPRLARAPYQAAARGCAPATICAR